MHELFFEIKPYSSGEEDEFVNPFTLGIYVTQGKRPAIPDMTTASPREKEYITLMEKSWAHDPNERPLFKNILEKLEELSKM
jgi:hypothetical protein